MVEASDEFLSKQRLLVLSPHADDEAYGCAGTIAKIAYDEGYRPLLYDGCVKVLEGMTTLSEVLRVTSLG